MVQTSFFNSFRTVSSFSEYRTEVVGDWSQQYSYQDLYHNRSSFLREWNQGLSPLILSTLTSQIDNGFWFSSFFYKDEIKNFLFSFCVSYTIAT